MKVYQLKDINADTSLYCKTWNEIKDFVGNDFLSIRILEMTERNYKELPEFSGF